MSRPRLLAGIVALVCANALLPRVASADSADGARARELVERYYALEQQGDYAGMSSVFDPDAVVRYRFDYGWWWPDDVIEFEVSEMERSGAWGEDSAFAFELAAPVREIESVQLAGDTAVVQVATRAIYTWSGESGMMKGRDEFQLRFVDGTPWIMRYESEQSF